MLNSKLVRIDSTIEKLTNDLYPDRHVEIELHEGDLYVRLYINGHWEDSEDCVVYSAGLDAMLKAILIGEFMLQHKTAPEWAVSAFNMPVA